MAALTQCRALTGCKAFTVVKPGQKAQRISNGSKYFMRKKDSFMVEVEVGEDEPEDVAVRRYMKQVMQSRVIEQLRARKTKETPLEEYKRRTRERIELRKMGVIEPTWGELYGADMEVKPFDEFFLRGDEDDEFGGDGYFGALDNYQPAGDEFLGIMGGYENSNSNQNSNKQWNGGYAENGKGGYMNNNQQGGYMNAGSNSQQGGYMGGYQQSGYQQGGYMS